MSITPITEKPIAMGQEMIVQTLVSGSESTHARITELMAMQTRQREEMMRLMNELQDEQQSLRCVVQKEESEISLLMTQQTDDEKFLNMQIDRKKRLISTGNTETVELTKNLDGLRAQNKALRDQEIYWTSPSGRQARCQMAASRYQATLAAERARAAAEAARNAHLYQGRDPGDHESRGSNW